MMKNAKHTKKIIKELYEKGELSNIINMKEEYMKSFGDNTLIEYEKSKAQLFKDYLDCLDNIEEAQLIPLVVSCQSVLFLQSIIFKLCE